MHRFQVMAAALAVLPRALGQGSLTAEDAVPLAAAALELLFVAALDAEQLGSRHRAQSGIGLHESLLSEQGASQVAAAGGVGAFFNITCAKSAAKFRGNWSKHLAFKNLQGA